MRFSLVTGALCILLIGCGAVPPLPASGPEVAAAPVVAPTGKTALVLLGPEGEVRVGDSMAEASEAFPRPKEAFELSQLPPKFGKPYVATGWEGPKAGFGMIANDARVVLAMAQYPQTDVRQVGELKTRYENRHPGLASNFVSGANVRYWFWEDQTASGDIHRLMLCAVDKGSGLVSIVVALGDSRAMDAVGASRAEAIRARRTGAPATTP